MRHDCDTCRSGDVDSMNHEVVDRDNGIDKATATNAEDAQVAALQDDESRQQRYLKEFREQIRRQSCFGCGETDLF